MDTLLGWLLFGAVTWLAISFPVAVTIGRALRSATAVQSVPVVRQEVAA